MLNENQKIVLNGVLFILNELELEVSKLTAPQLTARARQYITEAATKKIRGVRGEIVSLFEEPKKKLTKEEELARQQQKDEEELEADLGVDDDDDIIDLDEDAK